MPPKAVRKDPYQNFRFRAEIDGIVQAGFTEIVLPDSSAEVIEYREGIDMSTEGRKIPGRIHYGNLILRSGVSNSMELYNWWKLVEQGQNARKNMSVILLNDERADSVRWNFSNAWPVRIRYSTLDAKGHDILIEILEIAVEGMARV